VYSQEIIIRICNSKKMKNIIALILFSLGLQAQNVLIGENSLLTGRGYCEPSISINPKNSANIVAACILDKVFYSNDSGRTWQEDALESPFGVWGDPVLTTDTAGHHYYFHLSDPTGENWKSEEILDRIVAQKSTDGGKSWSAGSFMGFNHPKDQDKHWAVVDPFTNNIYVTWTQFDDYGSEDSSAQSNILFSTSVDGGQTWSEAKQINEIPGDCLDDDGTTEGAVPAVGPDGTIYVSWALDEKLYFDRSHDGGKTWLENDLVVTEQNGGWDIDVPGVSRANGMPVTVCDLSESEHSGRLYINWVDDRNGHYDVWLTSSDDGGDTWSVANRINDDQDTADQFFTWLTVDQTNGNLYCVFYDRRNLDGFETDVYLASSTDGGESWKNEKINDETFKTNPLVFFGDYNHISAHDGMVRPIWTALYGVKMGIYTSLLNFKAE
jgi:hypothetical protein